MTLFDITLPMQETLACWPGDVPYSFHLGIKRSEGASVNVGSLTMSVHSGTHADAPFHFSDEAATSERLDPSLYIGPALVADVRGRETIRIEDLRGLDLTATPRILLRTDFWTDHTCFPKRVPVMEADVPAFLQAQGVVLVGVDVPSVDALDSKELPVHHALAAAGIHILESLCLAEVPAGRYELIALPLKLVGADGSPIRAVLRSLPP